MFTTFMIMHAALSILLVLLVLLQFGKGAEAGLISGAGSDAVFSGATKGNIMTKITTVVTVLFFISSIHLARMQTKNTSTSIMDSETPITTPQEAQPKTNTPPVTEQKQKAEEKTSTK